MRVCLTTRSEIYLSLDISNKKEKSAGAWNNNNTTNRKEGHRNSSTNWCMWNKKLYLSEHKELNEQEKAREREIFFLHVWMWERHVLIFGGDTELKQLEFEDQLSIKQFFINISFCKEYIK